MGKKHSRFAKGVSKWINNCKSDRSKLLKSVVSLVLTSVILVTCTFCWYFIKTAEASGANFKLNAGEGLRVNDSGTSQFESAENDFTLLPASSVDGRNLYFPTDDAVFSDVTKDITYRSANVGDKNTNYIQIDFEVTAQANHTCIYLNDDPEKTFLKIYNKSTDPDHTEASAQQAAPLRMAIWSSAPQKDGSVAEPVVFNSQAKTVTTPAVSEVDRGSGEYIISAPQTAHQFSDYAVGGTPLATLSAGKKTKFSVIIWLEGNDPKCTWSHFNKINKSDIYLGLAFKTSWDNTEVIRFKDGTGSLTGTNKNWIQNKIDDGYVLTLRYTDANNLSDVVDFNTYKYRQTDNEWTASVPSDMRNKITFILSPPSGTSGNTYTFCVNSKNQTSDVTTPSAFTSLADSKLTYNRGVNRQYVVDVAANETLPSACRGYWTALGDSDGGGVDIGDLDGDDF